MRPGSHIISGLQWQTSLDKKEMAPELQERLSAWSRISMPEIINNVFDKLCPPEQTWRINTVELDLGITDFADLEKELGEKLNHQLKEKLTDLILYTTRNGNNFVEITDEKISSFEAVKFFLLKGSMPWSYKQEWGSVNQIVAVQLNDNNKAFIELIKQEGATHENVRKRLAWQINETNIVKIIKGLEPANHKQIFEVSDELTKIQDRASVVKASNSDFKKNLWHWILNYLLTNRGTIFNKVAFLESNIRQVASHYNLEYSELLALIEQAVSHVNENENVNSEFIVVLKLLTEETRTVKSPANANGKEQYWNALENYLKEPVLLKSAEKRNEFNDLVINLSKNDNSKFKDLIKTRPHQHLSKITPYLNESALSSFFRVKDTASFPEMRNTLSALNNICGSAGLNISSRTIWEYGVKFKLQPGSSSFNSKAFLSYCISEISLKKRTTNKETLEAILFSETFFFDKTGSGLNIYHDLVSLYTSEISVTKKELAKHLKKLIRLAGARQSSNKRNKSVFSSGIRMMEVYIQHNSQLAFEVLTGYPDKNAIEQLMPYLLGEESAKLLSKHLSNEFDFAINDLIKASDRMSSNMHKNLLRHYVNEHRHTFVTQLNILSPRLSRELIIKRLLQQAFPAMHTFWEKEFRRLMKFIPGDTNSQVLKNELIHAVKVAGAQRKFSIKELSNETRGICLSDKKDVSKRLLKNFDNSEFVKLRKNRSKRATGILNYLIRNGEALKNTLIKKYTSLIISQEISAGEQEIKEGLSEIFWRSVLDYKLYNGNVQALIRQFHMAALFNFYPEDKQADVCNLPVYHKKNQVSRLKDGKTLSCEKLFLFLSQCITSESKTIARNGTTYYFDELIHIAIAEYPSKLRKMFTRISPSEKRVSLLSRSVSFDDFTFGIMNGANGTLSEVLYSIRYIYYFALSFISGSDTERFMAWYWRQIWFLIKNERWQKEKLSMIIQVLFRQLSAQLNVTSVQIKEEMSKDFHDLPVAIKNVLIKETPFFSDRKALESEMYERKMQALMQKGILDVSVVAITESMEIPEWLKKLTEETPESLMKAIASHYPFSLLTALKSKAYSEQHFRWLFRVIGFKGLLRAIKGVDRSKNIQLGMLEKFYSDMENVSLKGMTGGEIQFLLFSKLLKSWINNDWKAISVELIWHELLWDLNTRYKYNQKSFIEEIEKIIHGFAPALQVAFKKLKNDFRTPLPVELPVNAPKKKIHEHVRRKEEKSIQEGGITVNNAGLVLLNSYIPVLFERLNLIANKQFLNEELQNDAIHYLQYLVTGSKTTSEEYLVLNKILCGLPVSVPVKEGIEISSEHEDLMKGLINAVIGHWPSIGNCSIDGFRGNWLVRNGLLIEQDDKWELKVEKRPYDLLIDRSPFSLSIIKYKWMGKPLHIHWSY